MLSVSALQMSFLAFLVDLVLFLSLTTPSCVVLRVMAAVGSIGLISTTATFGSSGPLSADRSPAMAFMACVPIFCVSSASPARAGAMLEEPPRLFDGVFKGPLKGL